MAKEQKTKGELEAMLRENAKEWTYANIEVRPDPIYGWVASIVADPTVVIRYQNELDYMASRMRHLYDLKR
jgi:hypothetical protein